MPVDKIAPRFSIATPTRNDLAKLKRCVGSIRGQQGITVEHLIQDACSGDGTSAWLTQQTDVRFVSERDQGMYDAISRAWSRADGEFVGWLNADEQYLPGTLQRVAAYFDAHPNVDVLFSDYIVCDSTGQPIALRREIPFRRFYVVNSFLYAQSCTLFFRRRLLEAGLLQFDVSLRYAADKDLLLNLAGAGVVIHHMPGYTALFGIDGNNLSTHPAMLQEAEQVRLRHGAFRSRSLRLAVLGCRRFERLIRGAYVLNGVRYRFAKDAVPNYLDVDAKRIGGRYALSDAPSA